MYKSVLLLLVVSFSMDSYFCWITDINTRMLSESIDKNELKPTNTVDDEDEAGDNRLNLIFPGTKWCGPGNSADNYDDLGEETETDMCCREHDYCPDLIPGGGTEHNLTNTAFYTRLNCSCDEKFYDCLKTADTRTSKYIGVIYFNTLQTKCFREDYPVEDCVKRGGWFKTKCLEYSYNTTGEPIYQWFDVAEY